MFSEVKGRDSFRRLGDVGAGMEKPGSTFFCAFCAGIASLCHVVHSRDMVFFLFNCYRFGYTLRLWTVVFTG